MTSAFSTNDTECLNRPTIQDLDVKNLDEIWNEQRLTECIEWISAHQFERVSGKIEIGLHLIQVIYIIGVFFDGFRKFCKNIGLPTVLRQPNTFQHTDTRANKEKFIGRALYFG